MNKKVCNKCKTEKIFDDFYKDKDKKDGLKTLCKACVKLKASTKYNGFTEARKRANNKYRTEHKQKGLCKYCSEPLFWAEKCKKHYEQHLERDRIYRVKVRAERKKNGLCMTCGQDLSLSDRVGKANCINCMEDQYRCLVIKKNLF